MSIYSAAKDAANVLKEAGKINEYQKILDLIDDLFDKREKIEKLQDKIKQLEKKLRISNDYKFKNNAYYSKDGDGPFCSRCLDKNKDLIRVIKNVNNDDFGTCPECNKQVNLTGYIPPQPIYKPRNFR